jgi:hypothetical protein
MRNELAVLNDTKDLQPREIKALAEEKAREILVNIHQSVQRIEEAKSDAESAQNMKIGWFGKGTKEKVNATAQGLVKTNSAVAELSDLVQKSIGLTCASIAFARAMNETMAYMVVNGFQDEDGKIKKLTHQGQEAVSTIMAEAEDFVQRQCETEQQQKELDNKISENRDQIEKNAGKIAENKMLIAQNKAIIADLTEKLNQSEAKQSTLELTVVAIEDLAKKGAFAILISIVGFVCAVIALVLNFI